MTYPCELCRDPAIKRCSGCSKAWYCSEEHQKYHWIEHIFDCKPKSEITTAHYLALAVQRDLLPEDPQTCEDYGFDRAVTTENRSKLFGLYVGLIKHMDIPTKKIHKWRINGTLIQEIKAAFEKLPPASRGGYYPWFLQNQYVLDSSLQPPSDLVQATLEPGRRYVGLPVSLTQEQVAEIVKNWPKNKQRCYSLCMPLLSHWHPAPFMEEWLYFGFCTCDSEESEMGLGALYRQLLDRCTFEEFCVAFEASSIIALFDHHGFKPQRENFHNLEDVLSGSPHMNKSVWDLKQFVMNKDMRLIPSVNVDYGYMNCRTPDEYTELKGLYKQLFELEHKTSFDPVELHNAAIRGKIFEYASGVLKFKKGQKKLYTRLMRNPYPLAEY